MLPWPALLGTKPETSRNGKVLGLFGPAAIGTQQPQAQTKICEPPRNNYENRGGVNITHLTYIENTPSSLYTFCYLLQNVVFIMVHIKKPTVVPTNVEAALAKAVEAWVSGDKKYFEDLDKSSEIAEGRRNLLVVLEGGKGLLKRH